MGKQNRSFLYSNMKDVGIKQIAIEDVWVGDQLLASERSRRGAAETGRRALVARKISKTQPRSQPISNADTEEEPHVSVRRKSAAAGVRNSDV